MNTYIFVEKNGNATLTLSAEDETEAWARLYSLAHDNRPWRLDTIEDEDGKTPRERHAEDFPEDARARTFDGGF